MTESMWHKSCLTIFCIHFCWTVATRTISIASVNSTSRGDANLPTLPVDKTKVECFSHTDRTTVAHAEAFISRLMREAWVHQNVTWSRNMEATPGHLHMVIPWETTELTLYAKNNTYAEDTLVLADYVQVLRNIVKDCIAQSRYTAGRAFIGPKGIVGVILSGLMRRDLLFGSMERRFSHRR